MKRSGMILAVVMALVLGFASATALGWNHSHKPKHEDNACASWANDCTTPTETTPTQTTPTQTTPTQTTPTQPTTTTPPVTPQTPVAPTSPTPTQTTPTRPTSPRPRQTSGPSIAGDTNQRSQLAFTGRNTIPLLLVGGLLTASGIALLAIPRWRRRS